MAKTKNQGLPKVARKKLVFLLVVVFIAILVLGLNLAYISASSGENYSKVVLNSRNYESKTIPFRRGTIMDANGETLAVSEKVYYVILDCSVLNACEPDEQNATIMALTACFGDQGITEELIRNYMVEKAESRYIRLLSEQTYEKISPYIEKQEVEDSLVSGSAVGFI